MLMASLTCCLKLNPGGPDKISPRLLKETAYQMPPLLTFIFQSSPDQGKLPQDWKSGNILPIYKKGNRAEPSNYQPMSLTSTCCKILEHIIYCFISTHLFNHNILCTNQHGFRTDRSCDTQLLMIFITALMLETIMMPFFWTLVKHLSLIENCVKLWD